MTLTHFTVREHDTGMPGWFRRYIVQCGAEVILDITILSGAESDFARSLSIAVEAYLLSHRAPEKP